MRIVSLIPEATEILAALGLGDEVVTIPPDDVRNVDRDDVRDVERLAVVLRAAQPTLIFTSGTSAGGGMPRDQVRRAVAQMATRPRPAVYALEPRSVGEILSDVKTVGDAVGRQGAARTAIEALRARIDAVSLRSARTLAESRPRRVVCLQGANPPVAAGWWLAELVGLAGGLDVLGGVGRPPRAVTWDQVRAAQPDLAILVGSKARRLSARQCDLTAPIQIDAQRPAVAGGDILPGPGVVDLLEQLLALILHIGQDLSASPDSQV